MSRLEVPFHLGGHDGAPDSGLVPLVLPEARHLPVRAAFEGIALHHEHRQRDIERHLALAVQQPRDLIDYPSGGCLSLQPAGGPLANDPGAKPTRDDLIRRVTAVLKGEPMRRLFGALVEAGEPVSREDLAGRCGYTVNGHFNNLCGALSGIGVAEYPQKGFVGLTSIFKGLA